MRLLYDARKLPALLFATAFGSACQSDARPPFADDRFSAASKAQSKQDASSSSPLIRDGKDSNKYTCGETTIELEIQKPNFYFVLDASGSMLETMPNSGGISRHLGARRAIGSMLRSVGRRVNFGAATFPEQGGCSPGAEVYAVRPGEAQSAEAGDGPALDGLMFTLRNQAPNGATPVSQTLRDLSPKLLDLPGATTVFLLTDGAPNCDLSEPCAPDRCIPNIEELELDDGRVCGQGLDCCTRDLAPHLCLDDDDTEDALRTLAEAGIKTYVIGIPGSETYAQILNQMAIAARTAQEGDSEAYYRVDDAEELALTLSDLGTQLSVSCSFELGTKPKQLAHIGVLLDGRSIDLDDKDGFFWATDTALELDGKLAASGKAEKSSEFECWKVVLRRCAEARLASFGGGRLD